MESRANHVLVGIFVLAAVAGLLAFVVWLAGSDRGTNVRRYRIEFEESVQGLGAGGAVMYRGLHIGSISDIGVNRDDPSRISVIVELRDDVPIRRGDVATLRFQGLTGLAAINIEGAKAGHELLTPKEGGEIPTIPSRVSHLERLFAKSPDLLNSGIVLAERASELLKDENQVLITGILSDVKTLTGALAARREDIEDSLAALGEFSADLAETAATLRELTGKAELVMDDASTTLAAVRGSMENLDTLAERDLPRLLRDVRAATRAVENMSNNITRFVAANQDAVYSFTEEGLPELTRFVIDARMLVVNLTRLSDRIESGGASFLFGESRPEFEAE